MSIFGQKIGGNRYCRKCGGYHGCVPSYHCSGGKVSPLQDAQMAIEKLEEFLEKASIKISAREEVKRLILELRDVSKIPTERIYCEPFYFPEEVRGMEQFSKALKESLGHQRKKKGFENKEMLDRPSKQDYSYSHPREILEISADIFGKLKEILNDNLFATELSKKEYDSIIIAVKEKVLKLN